MSNVIESIERAQLRTVPRFKAGDTVRVHFQVIEGQRRRVQVYEGIVIKRQGSGVRETFTVRKQSFGVGVERTFPLHSPKIEKIEVAAIGDVNRAKLYYLRGRVGKKARVRERRYGAGSELPQTVTSTLQAAADAPPEAEAVEAEVDAVVEEAARSRPSRSPPSRPRRPKRTPRRRRTTPSPRPTRRPSAPSAPHHLSRSNAVPRSEDSALDRASSAPTTPLYRRAGALAIVPRGVDRMRVVRTPFAAARRSGLRGRATGRRGRRDAEARREAGDGARRRRRAPAGAGHARRRHGEGRRRHAADERGSPRRREHRRARDEARRRHLRRRLRSPGTALRTGREFTASSSPRRRDDSSSPPAGASSRSAGHGCSRPSVAAATRSPGRS